MKLFTFSGIEASFTDINEGFGLIEFATSVIDALPPASQPSYDGRADIGHFRSFVNLSALAGDFGNLVTLNGSEVLNREASAFAPKYGRALLDAEAGETGQSVLVLAHSQGTNNLAHTLIWIFNNQPEFFDRDVRCAIFDPKVGANYVETIFSLAQLQRVSFLFFQSENDLLGNQSLLASRFIDQFEHGDHLWMRGLDHSSIRDWKTMNKEQGMLILPDYHEFRRAYRQKKMALLQARGKPGLTINEFNELQKFVKNYSMLKARPSEALLGFLQGSLPAKFKS